MAETQRLLEKNLIEELYGDDLIGVKDGTLIGAPDKAYIPPSDLGLYNQRGIHWPTP